MARSVQAAIEQIAVSLPESNLSNDQLAAQFPDWTAEKILSKTGIVQRRIAGTDQFTSDLAAQAARCLFGESDLSSSDVDFLILCTQCPDYLLPTTACLVQARLGVPTSAGALDVNLGCSGYVYGLGLAKGLIETGQASNVLFITADTYSKYLRSDDQSVRTLFGDGAAATWVRAVEAQNQSEVPKIGPIMYGTDGSGADKLIVRGGATRDPQGESMQLEMNGPDVFSFTMQTVPKGVNAALEAANIRLEEVDFFVFHQANAFMLEHLRVKCGIDESQFIVAMENCGNTVSSSIPIALHAAHQSKQLKAGDRILLVGFGVGFSWGTTFIQWQGN